MIWDPYGEFQSATLGNGLKIYALQMPSCGWQRIQFIVHSGALQDKAGKEGTAHFVEHLISENAPVECTVLEDYFNNQGGAVMLGATNYWQTYYRCFIPAKNDVLEQTCSYFGDMLLNEKLEKSIDRETSVILKEYNKKYPMKFRYELDMKKHKELYKGLPLERCLCSLGTPWTITGITKDDLQTYYDTHYTPANMTIVAVGNYSLDELVATLSKSPFAQYKSGKRTVMKPIHLYPEMESNRLEFNLSTYMGKNAPLQGGDYESYVKIPLFVPERAIGLLSVMLNELLESEIRQKRAWTYNIKVGYWHQLQFYKLAIECASFDLKVLDLFEDVVESVVASVQDSEDLFNKVKKNRIAAMFMNDQNGLSILTDAANDIFFREEILSRTTHRQNIENVLFGDVCTAAQYWLNKKERYTRLMKP